MFLQQDRNEADEAKEKSSGLFDPSAEAFQESLKVTISLLAVAIILGLIWHFGRYKKKEKEKQSKREKLEDSIPSFRVAEYLRTEGRESLEDFSKSLEQQISALRDKQIRERKSTWLYKAERARLHPTRSLISFDLRRSRTRVNPEVNTAFDKDESYTSPRQSSISSFNDFRKKKSGQVVPIVEECSPSQSHVNLNPVSEENNVQSSPVFPMQDRSPSPANHSRTSLMEEDDVHSSQAFPMQDRSTSRTNQSRTSLMEKDDVQSSQVFPMQDRSASRTNQSRTSLREGGDVQSSQVFPMQDRSASRTNQSRTSLRKGGDVQSSQVFPMQDRSSSRSHHSQTSLIQEDDAM
ncbi:uncharacterized protein LOC114525806 isoform X2 [Dendronephthya gigantea]|uniref:uncharacterized protein LOC114525806 isoform X2 n=1 Tax=Dendronephthya gigantea TaxID=151771 RepID=UPI00106D7DD4|nr:uncharacterized protein LOC114525806 isoform X2 [Dendronephthya gigantea]